MKKIWKERRTNIEEYKKVINNIKEKTKAKMNEPNIKNKMRESTKRYLFYNPKRKEKFEKQGMINLENIRKKRKGKTYIELYGTKKANEITKKMSLSKFEKPTKYWLGKKRSNAVKEALSKSKKGKRLEEIMQPDIAIKRHKEIASMVFPKKDTTIENIIQKQLNEANIEYKKHIPIKLSNNHYHKPDILIETIDNNYKGLIIEADGDYWHSKTQQKEKDKNITNDLFNQGYYVARLSESLIKNKEFNIITYIDEIIGVERK